MLAEAVLCVLAVIGAERPGLPDIEATLRPGKPQTLEIASTSAARNLSILVSLKQLGRLPPGKPVAVRVQLGETTLAKALHLGDPDTLWTIRQPDGIPARITLEADSGQTAPLA